MKMQFTTAEIQSQYKIILATLEATNAPKKVLEEAKKAFEAETKYYVKTDSVEAKLDETGFYMNIDEQVAIDAANVYVKHASLIVSAANSLMQAIKLFHSEWVEKIDSKLGEVRVAIMNATAKEKREEPDDLEKDMTDMLFKDGVAKVSVKMENGDERVIRRANDDDRLKSWGEL